MQCLEIITIGLPFCVFKIVTGLFFHQYWLIGLGIIDVIINLVNLLFFFFKRKRIFHACFLSFLVCFLKRPDENLKAHWQELGDSMDVLLSFTLVAYVIGGGYIKALPPVHLSVWNLSVILNVFGAGYSRVTHSIKNLRL